MLKKQNAGFIATLNETLNSLLHRLLCRIGLHHYILTSIIASLNGFWVQGGKQCYYCHKETITVKAAGIKAEIAYWRGYNDIYNAMTAYDGERFNIEDWDILPNTETLDKFADDPVNKQYLDS